MYRVISDETCAALPEALDQSHFLVSLKLMHQVIRLENAITAPWTDPETMQRTNSVVAPWWDADSGELSETSRKAVAKSAENLLWTLLYTTTVFDPCADHFAAVCSSPQAFHGVKALSLHAAVVQAAIDLVHLLGEIFDFDVFGFRYRDRRHALVVAASEAIRNGSETAYARLFSCGCRMYRTTEEERLDDMMRLEQELLRAAAIYRPNNNQAAGAEKGEPEVIARAMGRGVYCIGDETIKLEPAEDNVLTALIQLGGAATKDELIRKSGPANAPAVLRRIVKKWPALKRHITLPGARGKGGYRTTIRPA